MSTVSDKNKPLGVNFVKFAGVTVVCCFDKKKSQNLILLSILCTHNNKMLIKYFCKVSTNTKLYLLFFHWLICILFHVKAKCLPEQRLKPFRVKMVKLWVRKIINDGVDASTRKSQAGFQIIRDSNNLKTSLRFPCLGLNPILNSFFFFFFFLSLGSPFGIYLIYKSMVDSYWKRSLRTASWENQRSALISENKGETDQRLCFRYTYSTIPLLSKSKISSF